MRSKVIAFVVAEANKLKKGEKVAEAKAPQSAPQYYELPQQFSVAEQKVKVLGRDVKFSLRSYPPEILMAEAIIEVENIFSAEAFELREKLIDTCHRLLKERGGKFEMSEEYAIAVVSDYQGDPEQFFNQKAVMAGFLKSEKLPLDEKEIEYTLSKQLKYAKDDLVIVDWDGAFVFDPHGEIESIVDLFQTANLQLLRYRILDTDLGDRLSKAPRFVNKTRRRFFFGQKELTRNFEEIIRIRTHSIAEFETFERDVKLIGDWYSARLYDLITKKFKLDEWRSAIKEKFESLEDIYNIVSENFSLSRNERLEMIQIILFFVLQLGWFALIILEFMFYTQATEKL